MNPKLCARAWCGIGKLYGETGLKLLDDGNATLFKPNAASTNKLVAITSNQVIPISSMSVNSNGEQVVIDEKSNPYSAFLISVVERPLRMQTISFTL